MAELGVYCIRDKVAKQSGPLFEAVNDGVARREMVKLLSKIASYDRDAFELWKVGLFDREAGILMSMEEAQVIDVTIPNFEDVKQRDFGFEGR